MGIDQWREETEWPLSRAVDTDFHLYADGCLTQERPSTAEQPEAFRYDPMDPAPTTGGALYMSDDFRPGPLDQSGVEAREDVRVFTTEPLAEDVEVTGRVRAVLFAATDGPSTDWVARLCDVDENGVSRNVVDGIVRVRATRVNPRRARPPAEWPTSSSSTIPPGPPASSYRWFRSGRERGSSLRATCGGAISRPDTSRGRHYADVGGSGRTSGMSGQAGGSRRRLRQDASDNGWCSPQFTRLWIEVCL